MQIKLFQVIEIDKIEIDPETSPAVTAVGIGGSAESVLAQGRFKTGADADHVGMVGQFVLDGFVFIPNFILADRNIDDRILAESQIDIAQEMKLIAGNDGAADQQYRQSELGNDQATAQTGAAASRPSAGRCKGIHFQYRYRSICGEKEGGINSRQNSHQQRQPQQCS